MESKTNYTVVGIIVLFLSAAMLSTLLWLSVSFDRKRYNDYIVYMNESVHGLTDNSPVKFNGVKVGMVSSIELDPVNPQKIRLLLKVDEGVLITTSTRATLVTQGITGTTFLGLKATSSTLEPLQKTANEPYPVIPYAVSFFGQVENNVTEISDALKQIIDPENAQLVKQSLVSLQQILKPFANNRNNINAALEALPKAIIELQKSAQEFRVMTKHMTAASEDFSQAMKAGKAGMDQINEQTLPTTTAFLRRLDIIAANLEEVSALMRQNPAVIVRGSVPQPSGPGE